ncbi:MAG TPA: hypothetical protein ENK50_08135 [Sedimenticola sp.]|nr:hypothetical protein [Sedimenticola sp.]
MKILILGLGKSGTTALVYKIAAGRPGCRAFSGGRPGKHIGDYPDAVYKHTYSARKGKDFELYREHLRHEHYDRKIWMARDPRDAAVSRMLYRWHRGIFGHRQQYQAHLERVLRKERTPRALSFAEVCRYSGHDGFPRPVEAVVEGERERYREMVEFVGGLGPDWHLFTFEQMGARDFDGLNAYLGFRVGEETEIPPSTGKAKVIRKKATGDWRHWFTEEDVALFGDVYRPYMELIGYDTGDWRLAADPVIEPRFSSGYMQSLPERLKRDTAARIRNQAFGLFRKRA